MVETEATKDEAKSIDTVKTSSIRLPDDMEVEITSNERISKNKSKSKERIFYFANFIFSFLLVIVGFLQYNTYTKQAEIATNSNILSQYEYRFEFYKKVEDLQKTTAIIHKEPQLGMEEFSKLNFEILSLLRESELLFNSNISDNINKILTEHINFLVKLNNEGMYHDDYKEGMFKLNKEYGEFLNSDSFKDYLNINKIN